MVADDESRVIAEKRVGRVIAQKWRLEKLVGAGGMAAVYRASHVNNLKTVAIKILHPELGASGDMKRRFLREGYVANKVGHAGAVSVIDDGTDDDGAAFLVMELLEGETLGERAGSRGGVLSPRETLGHADRILEVLAAAHGEGIVHRDLKPDNIFLTSNGELKILDFGVARILDSGTEQTRAGVVMGTPEYMPPEQARGRTAEIDGRADLFAVGALMFRLISGKYVHEAETGNETLLRAMTEPAPAFASVYAETFPELTEVVDTALAFEREKRYPDAKAMQVAVRKALDVARAKESANTLAGVPSPFAAGAGPASGSVDASAQTAAAVDPPSAGGSKKNLWAHQEASEKPHVVAKPPRTGSPLRWVLLVLLLAGLATGGFLLRDRILHAAGTTTAGSGSADPAAVLDAGDDDDDAALDDDEDDAAVDADEPDVAADATTDAGHDAARTYVPPAPTKKPPPKRPPRRRH
jgi:serine/threonine-protein kinase